MKVTVPDELKAELPASTWGKILGSTPVVMAVIATLLAGLSSSEMTRAQYDRSLAAQHQSKAGDQWSFFQAKKLRGAVQRSAAETLENLATVHAVDGMRLREALAGAPLGGDAAEVRTRLLALLDSPEGGQALTALATGAPPALPAAPAASPALEAALAGVEAQKPEAEIAAALHPVGDQALLEALDAAQGRAKAFDTAAKPTSQAIERLEAALTTLAAAADLPAIVGLRRDVTAARMRLAAARYDAEARCNQRIADLLELQVRTRNLAAEAHHRRSQTFFIGMLAAQLGVVISTLAVAARRRSLLWSIAAASGAVAVITAISVYLAA